MYPNWWRVKKIVSGGQTGVDRAALDAAMELNFQYGGWCPRGRLAEDGPIPLRYQLTETESKLYKHRTEQNVIDSDATLVLTRGNPTGGTALTIGMARKHGRPFLVLEIEENGNAALVRDWLREHAVSILNVAGPRESTAPGIGKQTVALLRSVFKD